MTEWANETQSVLKMFILVHEIGKGSIVTLMETNFLERGKHFKTGLFSYINLGRGRSDIQRPVLSPCGKTVFGVFFKTYDIYYIFHYF